MQDVRTDGISQGKPAVLLVLYQQPGANVIEAVNAVRRLLPSLQKDVPDGMAMEVVSDRTPTIRASLNEIQKVNDTIKNIPLDIYSIIKIPRGNINQSKVNR